MKSTTSLSCDRDASFPGFARSVACKPWKASAFELTATSLVVWSHAVVPLATYNLAKFSAISIWSVRKTNKKESSRTGSKSRSGSWHDTNAKPARIKSNGLRTCDPIGQGHDYYHYPNGDMSVQDRQTDCAIYGALTGWLLITLFSLNCVNRDLWVSIACWWVSIMLFRAKSVPK